MRCLQFWRRASKESFLGNLQGVSFMPENRGRHSSNRTDVRNSENISVRFLRMVRHISLRERFRPMGCVGRAAH